MQVRRIVRSCEREGRADRRGVACRHRDGARTSRDAWACRGVLNSNGDVGRFHRGRVAARRGCLTAMRCLAASDLWRHLPGREIRGDHREGQQRECDPPDGSHAHECASATAAASIRDQGQRTAV